jgi:hypothetical protein
LFSQLPFDTETSSSIWGCKTISILRFHHSTSLSVIIPADTATAMESKASRSVIEVDPFMRLRAPRHVTHVEPERALVLAWWGAFVLVPTPENRTRLFVRSKVSDPKVPVWGAALSFAIFELPHFIMERQMLRGIKARAESQFEPAPAAPPGSALADR